MTEQLTLMWILRKTLRGRCCHEAHTALGDRGPWRLLGGKAGPGAQAAGPPAPSIAFLCRARSHSFLLWNLIFSKSAATLNHTYWAGQRVMALTSDSRVNFLILNGSIHSLNI